MSIGEPDQSKGDLVVSLKFDANQDGWGKVTCIVKGAYGLPVPDGADEPNSFVKGYAVH